MDRVRDPAPGQVRGTSPLSTPRPEGGNGWGMGSSLEDQVSKKSEVCVEASVSHEHDVAEKKVQQEKQQVCEAHQQAQQALRDQQHALRDRRQAVYLQLPSYLQEQLEQEVRAHRKHLVAHGNDDPVPQVLQFRTNRQEAMYAYYMQQDEET